MVSVRGTPANETLNGTDLDDILFGLDGNDILNALGGDDILRGGLGADQLNGGLGEDWADYRDATTGVTVNLSDPSLNAGEAAGDTFNSIERVRGGQFNDILVGDAFDNVLEGAGGADVLNGGGGLDFARYKDAPGRVTASLQNPALNRGAAAGDTYVSIEGLQGGNYADTLIGNGASNVLIGGRGADILNGRGGLDFARYDATDGSLTGVTASLANPKINRGDAFHDKYISIEGLIGTRLGDSLFGNALRNDLRGQAGNDRLNGYAGRDSLDGGSGNDRLFGGEGNDRLAGKSGNDSFWFNTALNRKTNVDRILDFSVTDDTIRIDNAVFKGVGAVGVLGSSRFHIGAAAHDANDRIIYNENNGNLYYDSDGTGAHRQVLFAQLSTKLALTNADIVVY